MHRRILLSRPLGLFIFLLIAVFLTEPLEAGLFSSIRNLFSRKPRNPEGDGQYDKTTGQAAEDSAGVSVDPNSAYALENSQNTNDSQAIQAIQAIEEQQKSMIHNHKTAVAILGGSLEMPSYSNIFVQDILEQYHSAAIIKFLSGLKEFRKTLKHYSTAIHVLGQRLLPDLSNICRLFQIGIVYPFIDLQLCMARFMYVGDLMVSKTLAGETLPGEAHAYVAQFNKVKIMHLLGLHYIIVGRLIMLNKAIEESISRIVKEVVKRYGTNPQTHAILYPLTNVSAYIQDCIAFSRIYFEELRHAFISAIVHPRDAQRIYRHVHFTLQAASQFITTATRSRLVGEELSRIVKEMFSGTAV